MLSPIITEMNTPLPPLGHIKNVMLLSRKGNIEKKIVFWYSDEEPGRAVAPPSPLLAVTFGTARMGLGGAAARPGPSLLYQM